MKRTLYVELSESDRIMLWEMVRSEETPLMLKKRCKILLMANEKVGKVPTRDRIGCCQEFCANWFCPW